MAVQPGFTYVFGDRRYAYSTVSSTATFRARNPVTFDARGFLIEAASDSSAIYGIACNNAADSLAGLPGKTLVEIPEPETIYLTTVQTGAATSLFSVGRAFAIEKSGNYFRLDSDSAATAYLVIAGDQYGNQVNSDDSSVQVRWLAERLLMSSGASVPNFAEL